MKGSNVEVTKVTGLLLTGDVNWEEIQKTVMNRKLRMPCGWIFEIIQVGEGPIQKVPCPCGDKRHEWIGTE